MASVPAYNSGTDVTETASAALNGTNDQFRVVIKEAAGTVARPAADGDQCHGIQQEPIANAAIGAVRIMGPSKCVLGATLTPNARVMAEDTGRLIAHTAGQYCFGYILTGGAADEIGVVMITHEGND